jgi:hypothetical protein
MSVSLFMKGPDRAERVVPISTERVFEDYWQPAATKLGLKWVPLFQTGLPLTMDDLPVVLTELALLKGEFGHSESLPPDIAEYVTGRVENLISALESTKHNGHVEVYIG